MNARLEIFVAPTKLEEQVLAFFRTNPDEELTDLDLGVKFGVSDQVGDFPLLLRWPLRRGLLARRVLADGSNVWLAGRLLPPCRAGEGAAPGDEAVPGDEADGAASADEARALRARVRQLEVALRKARAGCMDVSAARVDALRVLSTAGPGQWVLTSTVREALGRPAAAQGALLALLNSLEAVGLVEKSALGKAATWRVAEGVEVPA